MTKFDSSALLRKGWPLTRVASRHRDFATALVAAGAVFGSIPQEHRVTIEKLVNERLTFAEPYKMAESAGGIRVEVDGVTVGGMVLEGLEMPGQGVAVRVTAVAVVPGWERKGVGTVLLGMIPQVVQPRFIYGGCAPEAAIFYQRAGFDVLAPGELLPFTLGSGSRLQSSNMHYPSWFIRHM